MFLMILCRLFFDIPFFETRSRDLPYQHIWQWHGTFEDCQSVRPWVWDQFSISIVLPLLSHGPVCTVIVSLLDILGVVFHICIHWPLIGFRLAIRGLGRIEGPRKAPNMFIMIVASWSPQQFSYRGKNAWKLWAKVAQQRKHGQFQLSMSLVSVLTSFVHVSV